MKKLKPTSLYEEKAYARGFSQIAGVDEAGRGPLAGPVVAAACMLPPGCIVEGVDDSKKLTPEERQIIYLKIIENPDIVTAVGVIDAIVIDQINILQATFQAMIAAVEQLARRPDYILVDGNQMPKFGLPGEAIVDGDALSHSIAAASIIAKVTRDRIMGEFHLQWPHYGFKQHKGYATVQHLVAIQIHGICPIHRKSFEPIRSSIALQRD